MEQILNNAKQQIDTLLAEKELVFVAIDGPCTSGKTTLAAQLAQIYDCNVFHIHRRKRHFLTIILVVACNI